MADLIATEQAAQLAVIACTKNRPGRGTRTDLRSNTDTSPETPTS